MKHPLQLRRNCVGNTGRMGSEKDRVFDPLIHLQRSQWQYSNLNGATKLNIINPACHNTSSILPTRVNHREQSADGIVPPGLGVSRQMMFQSCINSCCHIVGGTIPPGIDASRFIQLGPTTGQPLNPMHLPMSTFSQRRFVIFDQSEKGTRLIFSSMNPPLVKLDPVSTELRHPGYPSLQVGPPLTDDQINQSVETSFAEGKEVDEMRENTEEIDALLYSYSEDEEEEEASSAQYPPAKTIREEEVGSSGVPMKRRRLNEYIDNDPSLLDTASSTNSHHYQGGRVTENGGIANNMRIKKDRIHETLGLLRQIIPDGGDGKDATEVLNEAILYMESLKAQVFGVVL